MFNNQNKKGKIIMKTKTVFGLLFAVFVGMLLLLPNAALAEDVVVIANKSVPDRSLSINDVKSIFLSKKIKWSNGSSIDFVTLKDDGTTKTFLETYVNKTPSQYNRYYRTLVFTGKGDMPRNFESENDLVRYVANTPGAIGYVSSDTNTGSAKVISVN